MSRYRTIVLVCAALSVCTALTVRLRLRVPRTARGRICVRTTTTADLTRSSTRRGCSPVKRR
jgi:hypothetical protein